MMTLNDVKNRKDLVLFTLTLMIRPFFWVAAFIVTAAKMYLGFAWVVLFIMSFFSERLPSPFMICLYGGIGLICFYIADLATYIIGDLPYLTDQLISMYRSHKRQKKLSKQAPNTESLMAMMESERIAKDPTVKGYDSFDDLLADLRK